VAKKAIDRNGVAAPYWLSGTLLELKQDADLGIVHAYMRLSDGLREVADI
jgi:hypothetical protein